MKYIVTIDDTTYAIDVAEDQVTVGEQRYPIAWQDVGPHTIALLIGNRSFETVVVNSGGDEYDVLLAGERHLARVQDELTHRVTQAKQAAAAEMGEVTLTSPMPGLIVKMPVAAGDTVAVGDTLVILESMKMENELKSPRSGQVQATFVEPGMPVEKGQKLVTVGNAADRSETP